MKTAVVTGITGQDAAYLAQLLLAKGYTVFGTHRACSERDFWRIEELGIKEHSNLRVLEFDAVGLDACRALIERTQPTEIYNLAGQTSAVKALADPLGTAQVNGMVPVYWLEAVRRFAPAARFFQAGSSELFGHAQEVPQTETTPFSPVGPYGVAKLFAHWSVVDYREAYGVFAASGILFNHESPLRGDDFVTRKIARAFAQMKIGRTEALELGNLDAKRDWGYAKDFAEGFWSALQAEESDTFVFATNRMHTVREFVSVAARAAGFDLAWQGAAEKEIALDMNTGATLVRVNPNFFRPSGVLHRVGNPQKAFDKLRWRPTTTLVELCTLMVDAELRRAARGSAGQTA